MLNKEIFSLNIIIVRVLHVEFQASSYEKDMDKQVGWCLKKQTEEYR